MNYETFYSGQDVWITEGVDKGRKGVITGTGFGGFTIQLDAEKKFFARTKITTKNPQNVPLPPNFLPLDHKVGDTVVVSGHPFTAFNGITGTVTKLPTSTTYAHGGDKRYALVITDGGKSAYVQGDVLLFEPQNLKKACAVRIEGKEIAHADVRINDVILVEYRSGAGNYKQLSSKEGKVASITRKNNPALGEHPASIYTFNAPAADGGYTLNYNNKAEKVILVKGAEDPYVAILKGLLPGTTIVKENPNGSVTTYVRAPDAFKESQWHVVQSLSTRSSVFISDADVIKALNNGAEFVHKVRK